MTHGGKGAVNHYQSIKGAWGALPALKKGGHIILFAHNQDEEPIGSQHYKDLMKKFAEVGLGNFYPLICSDNWEFTHDQWEVQKWEQFFTRISGYNQLIYCTTNIAPKVLAGLQGMSGYKFIKDSPQDIPQCYRMQFIIVCHRRKTPRWLLLKRGLMLF